MRRSSTIHSDLIDADDVLAVGLGRSDEQRVGGRVGSVDLGSAIEPDRGAILVPVLVGRHHVDAGRLDRLSVLAVQNGKVADPRQDFWQAAGMLIDV